MSSNTIAQEHRGLAKVHSICAEMESIWRPTPNNDLGIDGQIEFLEEGTSISSGVILAVQVKSGPSYFAHSQENGFNYYPASKHRKYWGRINLPVILILHNPDSGLTIYTNVKPQLVNDDPIFLDSNHVFTPEARENLIECVKDNYAQFDPEQILNEFKSIAYDASNGNTISGIDFLLSTIDPAQRYFEIRMVRIIQLLDLINNEIGVTIHSETYDFIHRCIIKIVSSNLTEPFFSEFEKIWYDLGMVPDIAVPLTNYGKMTIEYLWQNLKNYISFESFKHLKIDDYHELAILISISSQEESDRLENSDKLGEVPR